MFSPNILLYNTVHLNKQAQPGVRVHRLPQKTGKSYSFNSRHHQEDYILFWGQADLWPQRPKKTHGGW